MQLKEVVNGCRVLNQTRIIATVRKPRQWGDRHTYSEYKTVWGAEQVAFERLTATNYIKTIIEEYRWGDKPATDFKVVAISN